MPKDCIIIYYGAQHNYPEDLLVAAVVELVPNDCIPTGPEAQHNY